MVTIVGQACIILMDDVESIVRENVNTNGDNLLYSNTNRLIYIVSKLTAS